MFNVTNETATIRLQEKVAQANIEIARFKKAAKVAYLCGKKGWTADDLEAFTDAQWAALAPLAGVRPLSAESRARVLEVLR